MPPCAVQGKSRPPPLHKPLGNDGDVAQKFGCGFQVPVGSVDVDVTQVCSQGQHVLPDSLTARWRRLQGPDCKRVTKLMNPWPSTAHGLEPRRFQQGSEYSVNFPIQERLPLVRNEDTVATTSLFLTVHQVLSQSRLCGVVQRYPSVFLKLGLANQQTVGSDVGDQQMQRLRDSQPGGCQKAD